MIFLVEYYSSITPPANTYTANNRFQLRAITRSFTPPALRPPYNVIRYLQPPLRVYQNVIAMQALFSRTAQARTSCRCMSCGQAAKAVSRRTTTAAPKRRVGAGDLFTACYSTLLASAAIADAEVKRERRKEWDRVIEEAKSERLIAEAGERELELELEQTTYSKISARSNSTYDDSPNSMLRRPTRVSNRTHGPATDSPLQGRLKQLDLRITQSLESTETATAETPLTIDGTTVDDDSGEVVEEWANESSIPGIGFREPRSSLHLSHCEDSTSRLVAELLGKIGISTKQVSSRTTNRLSDETKAILEAIEGLHSSFSKFPNFSWRSQNVVRVTRSALHTSIYKICQMRIAGKRDVDSIIAKICYNLLISTVPPSIITYNIMIGELSRLKLHDITEVIIQSYLCDTRFAPTMETIQLMLDHYCAKGDRAGFDDMLDRLRCTLPAGKPAPGGLPGKPLWNMRMGMRSIKQLYLPDIQEWAMQEKVIHRNGFLVRKAPRNSGIFESIIRGCLKMKSVRKATRYLKAAYREGQYIHSKWIYAIAVDCVKSLDHETGRLLLNTILSSWIDNQGNPLIDFSRNVRYAVYQLLGLCGVSVTNGLASLKAIHYIHCRENLQDLLLHMQDKSSNERLQMSAGRTLQAKSDSRLEALGGQGMSIFLRVPDSPEEHKEQLEVSQHQILRSQVSFIQHKLGNSAKRLCERQKEAASWTHNCLSATSRERYKSQVGKLGCSLASDDVHVERLRLLLHLVREERNPVSYVKVAGFRCRVQTPRQIEVPEPWDGLDEPTVRVAMSLGI